MTRNGKDGTGMVTLKEALADLVIDLEHRYNQQRGSNGPDKDD